MVSADDAINLEESGDGAAQFLGKSLRERADELINIAHSDFRPELRREAQKLLYP